MYDHRPLLKFAISAPSLIEINLPLFLHTFPFYSSKKIKKETPGNSERSHHFNL